MNYFLICIQCVQSRKPQQIVRNIYRRMLEVIRATSSTNKNGYKLLEIGFLHKN